MINSDHSVAINKDPNISMNDADYSMTTGTGSNNNNSFTGHYSVSHGNKATGDYSYNFTSFPGGCSELANNANKTFLFGICPNKTLVNNINNNDNDRFIIYGTYDTNNDNNIDDDDLKMKVGIGVVNPQATLDIAGIFKANTFTIKTTSNILDSNPNLNLYSFDQNNPLNNIIVRDKDLAEIFPTQNPVSPGDIVSIDPNNPKKLIKSNYIYNPFTIGVVSYSPAVTFKGNQVVLNSKTPSDQTTQPPIALAGRTLIKVCLENGSIKRGDLLTSSSTAGVAMRADYKPEAQHAIIAKALQDFSPSNKKIGKIVGLIIVR
jgi:hypothetical protein